MKSNITIASNIYHRASDEITRDPSYVAAIHDAAALKKVKDWVVGTLTLAQLSSWQKTIIEQGAACAMLSAGRTDAAHGLVKTRDGFVWSCRCEHTACGNYEACMSDPHALRIARDLPPKRTPEADDTAPPLSSVYMPLGNIINLFEPPTYDESDFDDFEEEEDDEAVDVPEPETALSEDAALLAAYTQIDSPNTVITADVNSHILINAGPGTGKTYAIIKRLEHLARTSAVEDFGSVLVLCYTNAAKNEIRKRLEAGIIAGELPPETRQFDIRTFDSLATAYLLEMEENNLSVLDYNARIARFNARFEAEMFAPFEYVIIDEMQDLVNERAKMTLNILSALTGGWLICGDKCQAIYDYDCDSEDKISSTVFYARLEQALPSDTQRYELVGNRRQSEALAAQSDLLREALLQLVPNDVNDFFSDEVGNHRQIKFSPSMFSGIHRDTTTAILCRSNGQAEWVSAELHAANIPHHLLRSVVHHPMLHRWIADVFWDYCEKTCTRDDFVERYCIRVHPDPAEANTAFDALASAVEAMLSRDLRSDSLDMQKVKRALRHGSELDGQVLNLPAEHLTVSTIHKAKGREFDRVYLLNAFNPQSNSTDEAKVWYVGATRPKNDMHVLEQLRIHFGKRTASGRCVEKGYARGRYGTKGRSYCRHIIVGLPDDVDVVSFVDGALEQALSKQSYIAGKVKHNDRVELVLQNNRYSVLHNGHLIGALDRQIMPDFWAAIKSTNNSRNLPPRITDIFVADIVTLMPYHHPSGIGRIFKESGFWLGVELTGFGKADWTFGGNA